MRVKAVVGVVVVYTPAEDPVAVTFFVRIPVIVVARGIGTRGNVEFELETVFPRRLISHGNTALAEARNFAELQNRAVGVERVQINAVHGRTDVTHFDGAKVFVAVERDV